MEAVEKVWETEPSFERTFRWHFLIRLKWRRRRKEAVNPSFRSRSSPFSPRNKRRHDEETLFFNQFPLFPRPHPFLFPFFLRPQPNFLLLSLRETECLLYFENLISWPPVSLVHFLPFADYVFVCLMPWFVSLLSDGTWDSARVSLSLDPNFLILEY